MKYWVKLYVESLKDSKLGKLPDNLWRRFIECLLLAGDVDEDGFLPALADMAWELRRPETTLQSELEQLAKYNLLEIKPYNIFEHRWFVTKFKSRQSPSAAAERKRLSRENAKKKKKDSPHTPLKEKEKEEDHNTQSTYCPVTVTVTPVTKRDNGVTNEGSGPGVGRENYLWGKSLDLIEAWQRLTVNRKRLRHEDKSDKEDYFIPALTIMDMFDGDDAAAWQAVSGEYNRMIADGLTVKRLAAVVPSLAAAANRANLPPELLTKQSAQAEFVDPSWPKPNEGGTW